MRFPGQAPTMPSLTPDDERKAARALQHLQGLYDKAESLGMVDAADTLRALIEAIRLGGADPLLQAWELRKRDRNHLRQR